MSAGRAPGSNPASAPSSPSSPCVTVKGLLHMLYPSGGDQNEERAHPALLPPPRVPLVLRQLELGTSAKECLESSSRFPSWDSCLPPDGICCSRTVGLKRHLLSLWGQPRTSFSFFYAKQGCSFISLSNYGHDSAGSQIITAET